MYPACGQAKPIKKNSTQIIHPNERSDRDRPTTPGRANWLLNKLYAPQKDNETARSRLQRLPGGTTTIAIMQRIIATKKPYSTHSPRSIAFVLHCISSCILRNVLRAMGAVLSFAFYVFCCCCFVVCFPLFVPCYGNRKKHMHKQIEAELNTREVPQIS